MNAPALIDRINIDAARQFLDALDPTASAWTFQVFDDGPSKRKDLTAVRHGPLEKHAAWLAEMNQRGAGVYVTINETDGKGRRAENVVRVRSLFVDFDDPTVDALPMLDAFEHEPSALVQSSEGKYHAYWHIESLAVNEFKPTQQALLQQLGGDNKVCDPSRVMRLPGFFHMKAAPQVVRLLKTTGQRYGLELADAIRANEPAQPQQGAPLARTATPERYGMAALESACGRVAMAAEGCRNDTLNREAFSIAQLVAAGRIAAPTAKEALLRAAAVNGLSHDEAVRTLQSAFESSNVTPRQITPRAGKTAVTLPNSSAPGVTIDPSKLSEDSLALIFERKHAHSLRFCHTSGAWYVWTGTRWEQEKTQLAFAWARDICREFGNGEPKFAKAATASAVERFAQSARCFSVTAEKWDRAPWLIGTPQGTIDLRTGELRQADPDDHITRQAGVGPAPAGTKPERWLAFLKDATRDDEGLIRFLQQMAGYALTGDTSEHALFFIYGAGGNGKSVFLNTLNGILAEYAQTAAMDTFAASKNDKHPTDLAMLKGARLVSASETEDGRAWAEAKIKQMTGGDPITARFMRRDFFTYRPEFKLVIVGNHKPRLNNVDDATRRRFNIIPFVHKPTKPNPDLERGLREEWPAILRWMIDGCLDWQANGLQRPAVVLEATREYFEDQDVFGQWLDECCEIDSRHKATNSELFSAWRQYSTAAGEDSGSAKAFGEAMRKRGFEPYRSNERGFKGIRVKPQAAHADQRFPNDWD